MRARIAIACVLACTWTMGTGARGQDAQVSVRLLDGDNHVLVPERDALEISHAVTNDGTLPASADFAAHSRDPRDVRIEVDDAADKGKGLWATIESLDGTTLAQRSVLRLPLSRSRPDQPFRSRFVRLVGDGVDLHAPEAEAQTLLVALRDRVRVRYESARGTVETVLRVGAPGASSGPRAARLAKLHVHVLRTESDGPPVIGGDPQGALGIVDGQIRVANAVWLQCNVTFGDPRELPIDVVSPPVPSLLAIGDGDGLPARGDGLVRFRVEGKSIGPIGTVALATPIETARSIEKALQKAGFSARVSENARTRFGAGASADVLVLRRDGSPARLSADGSVALCSDARQRLELGVVDLRDGLSEFDNMNAQVGTLEERALVKTLADDDPSTIDLFIVNRFTEATRQGEAFIAKGGGAIANAVILDRQGLRHLPLAWTLAHELGHVLLDDPLHPDNVGPDRPWLLMDADNSRGTVNGPKRLRPDDCERARARSASLLVPYDAEPPAGTVPVDAPKPTKTAH